jgi:hypothetical protein
LCISKFSFFAQIKFCLELLFVQQIEFYKYTDAKSLHYRCQKLRKSNICVYVVPSTTASTAASAALSAAVGAAAGAVGATITTIPAASPAAISIAATITVSATPIAAALWLIVICPSCCLCFHLTPPLPAPAIAAVVCWHHCHCFHRRNHCPCSFCCHHHHRCLFFYRWLHCLYVSTAAASVSVAPTCHRFCFHCCRATASVSNAIVTVVSAMAAITGKKG